MEGHLTDYLNKFQEKYQELLESGRDLYSCEWDGYKEVFALPNTEVEYNKDGSIEITSQILDILEKIFLGGNRDLDLKKRKIFQHRKEDRRDEFNLRNLEIIVNGRSACVETPYSG